MRVGRLVLVVATLLAILVFPLVLRDALRALNLPSAYAAPAGPDPAGRLYQNGNNRGDEDNENNNDGSQDNGHGEDNDNGGDNDNVECFQDLNSNEPVPCNFDNENRHAAAPAPAPAAVAPPPPARPAATKCFAVSEVGSVQLSAAAFDVTVSVVPNSTFPSATSLTLRAVDPATVPPATGGTLLDAAVWTLDAQGGCDGPAIAQLPSAVNLGFAYRVAADKSKLQIVHLEGGSWAPVTTVADPSPTNPFISATIQAGGTYAVVQRP
jgi:hypothetical protein